MTDFIAAIGLVLVIEGLVYAIAPGLVRSMLERLGEIDPGALRVGGLVAVSLGVFIVWLVRG